MTYGSVGRLAVAVLGVLIFLNGFWLIPASADPPPESTARSAIAGVAPAALLGWTRQADMPIARSSLGVVAGNNGRIYAVGGSTGGSRVGTVEEYDPSANSWATKASIPTPRDSFGISTGNDGRIYVVGGMNNNNQTSDLLEAYTPSSNDWVAKRSIPTPRSGLGLATGSNGKLYAIGGGSVPGGPPDVVGTVEEYDPATDTWTTRASMPTPRASLVVVSANNGKIYAIGGMNYSSNLATVEEYDPSLNTWRSRASVMSQ